jgi:hypothetical protein
MDQNQLAIGSVQEIGGLSELASQYGPFFFSILLIIFLPLIYQRIQQKLLGIPAKRIDQQQLHASLNSNRRNWDLSIRAGIVLIFLSVSWWVYYQFFILRNSEHLFVLQGTITNANEDDLFSSDDENSYFAPDPPRANHLVRWRFALIVDKRPEQITEARIFYTTRGLQMPTPSSVQGRLGGIHLVVPFERHEKRSFEFSKDPRDPNKGMVLLPVDMVIH